MVKNVARNLLIEFKEILFDILLSQISRKSITYFSFLQFGFEKLYLLPTLQRDSDSSRHCRRWTRWPLTHPPRPQILLLKGTFEVSFVKYVATVNGYYVCSNLCIYCPSWTDSFVLVFQKRNSLPLGLIWAFISCPADCN